MGRLGFIYVKVQQNRGGVLNLAEFGVSDGSSFAAILSSVALLVLAFNFQTLQKLCGLSINSTVQSTSCCLKSCKSCFIEMQEKLGIIHASTT
jgi:hypothetical protein